MIVTHGGGAIKTVRANACDFLTPSASKFRSLRIIASALVLVMIAWSALDDRVLAGAYVWAKPLKFSLSFVVLFWTIELVESRLTKGARSSFPFNFILWAMGIAFLSEMTYISYRAAHAEGSHFNISTLFHYLMYIVMAVGAVTLVAGVGALGWIVRRDERSNMTAGLRESIWLGFVVSFAMTLVVAGTLSAQSGPYVGEHSVGSPSIPLLGWSGVAGDLRVPHFLALHAMQVIPILAICFDLVDESKSVMRIRIATAIYTVLTFIVFGRALLGKPFVPLAWVNHLAVS